MVLFLYVHSRLALGVLPSSIYMLEEAYPWPSIVLRHRRLASFTEVH